MNDAHKSSWGDARLGLLVVPKKTYDDDVVIRAMSSPKRNVSLRRILRMMRLLQQPITLLELEDELQVTSRTIRRDINMLRAEKMPVWRCDETNCWRLGQPAPITTGRDAR